MRDLKKNFFLPRTGVNGLPTQPPHGFHTDINSPIGVHSGYYAAKVSSDYNHQDEWLIAEDVEISGDLTFWSVAYQGSVHLDHYYVKLSRNHGATWEILLDLSALPPYPGVNGYNQWNEPYTIDLSASLGQVVDLAWQVVDGDGQGAWYTWAIDDCKVGEGILKNFRVATSSGKYDIYRQDGGAGDFARINQEPVFDTTYLDPALMPYSYRYFVNSITDNCQQYITSDTIQVDVITGDHGLMRATDLKIFPNPARDKVYLVSSSLIRSVLVMDYSGRIVFSDDHFNARHAEVPVNNFSPGIFIFRIISDNGTVNSRVIIEH